MTTPSDQGIIQLLLAWSGGDQAALEKLTPLVYAEPHRLAKGYMLGERPGHTPQTTALINEAYLRLIDWKNVRWQSRAHFCRVRASLEQNPALCEVARGILQGRPCPTQESFYRLRSAGLFAGASARDVRPRRQLYSTYLEKRLR